MKFSNSCGELRCAQTTKQFRVSFKNLKVSPLFESVLVFWLIKFQETQKIISPAYVKLERRKRSDLNEVIYMTESNIFVYQNCFIFEMKTTKFVDTFFAL